MITTDAEDIMRNSEHYPDPTPAEAIRKADQGLDDFIRQEKRKLFIEQTDARGRKMLFSIKGILEAAGFELVDQLVIREKRTQRQYKCGGAKKC